MASRCNCCARPVEITEASRLRTVVYADPHTKAPYLYLALFECPCQNTLSVVLWEDEQSALDAYRDELREAAARRSDQRAEGPYDAAVHRGFFTLTHELAERGL
jgi:hypothetical protein